MSNTDNNPFFSKLKSATVFSGVFLTALFLYNFSVNIFPFTGKMNSSEFKYHTGLVKINEYLFHLNNECKRGQFDVAQNTFLDLQQHWQRQDVLLKSIQNQLVQKSYFPSDSLRRLEKFLNNIYLSNERGYDSMFVIKEIRRVNSRIDRMQSVSGY